MRPPISAPRPAAIAFELNAPRNETNESPKPKCFGPDRERYRSRDDRPGVDVVGHRRQQGPAPLLTLPHKEARYPPINAQKRSVDRDARTRPRRAAARSRRSRPRGRPRPRARTTEATTLRPRASSFVWSTSRVDSPAWGIIARLTSASSESASVIDPGLGQALDAQEQAVGEVALDRADRERADERARQPPQRAADADQLDVGPALVEDQLHHRQRVREHGGGEPALDHQLRHEVARRRRVEEDRLARRRASRPPPRRAGAWPPSRPSCGGRTSPRARTSSAAPRRRACAAPARAARARRGRGARSWARRRSATRARRPSRRRCCAAPRRSRAGASRRAPSVHRLFVSVRLGDSNHAPLTIVKDRRVSLDTRFTSCFDCYWSERRRGRRSTTGASLRLPGALVSEPPPRSSSCATPRSPTAPSARCATATSASAPARCAR